MMEYPKRSVTLQIKEIMSVGIAKRDWEVVGSSYDKIPDADKSSLADWHGGWRSRTYAT